MDKKPTLLAVLAHPDDETFGTGGTLALYAERGVEVHLVCATRGEAGDMDADCLDGFDSVAERRVSELRCAAGILGLSGVHFLNYRDSGMPGTEDNRHPQALINVRVPRVFDFRTSAPVQAAVQEAEADLSGSGRVLLRPSGTEPVLRVMVEGESQARVEHWAQRLADAVKAAAAS